MNPFELMNLRDLSKDIEDAAKILSYRHERTYKDAAKLIVTGLFEKYKGDPEKVKEDLRGDAEMYQGLNMTKDINNEFIRYNTKAKQGIYNENLHSKFDLFARVHRAS